MADAGKPSGEKKRISFLMPYIDFCFMLIIIFIGMLSIAYFEPLGTTDVQNQRDEVRDNREGRFTTKPAGIQKEKTGVGEEEPDSVVMPLSASGGAGGEIESAASQTETPQGETAPPR